MNGKKKCKILKEIRAQIAKDNDIAFITSECKHQGNCKGTCPKCEWEVRYLESELEKRRLAGKQVMVAGIAAAMVLTSSCTPEQKTSSSDSSSEASSAESVCSPAESEWVTMGEEALPESSEEVLTPGAVPVESSEEEFWDGEIVVPEDSSEEEAIVGELLPEESYEETMGEPVLSISLYGMDDLKEMREMYTSAEEDELERYILSLAGGGAESRKDLEKFLEAVDSLPLLSLIEGEVSWISYHNVYPDLVPERDSVIYITVETAPGEWVRTGYFIGVQDVAAEIERRKGYFEASTLTEPFYSKDGRVAVYTETAEDEGCTVTWIMTIDGILAETVYHTESAKDLRAETVLKDPVIGSLKNR